MTKYFTLITLTTVFHPDQGNSPATRNAKSNTFNQIIYLYYKYLFFHLRSPEDEKLYAGQNHGGKKKNNEANWMVSNSAKLDRRNKQHTQFGVSTSNGSRDMARTKSWQKKKKNNEANWMVSNSAKLDRRTKQHTQFGVSASNGSRDMARTKLWQNRAEKKNKITKRIGW